MQPSPCAKQLPQQVSGKGLVAPISHWRKVAVGNPILPADPCAGKTTTGRIGFRCSAPSLPVTAAHLSCNPWQKAICSGGRAPKAADRGKTPADRGGEVSCLCLLPSVLALLNMSVQNMALTGESVISGKSPSSCWRFAHFANGRHDAILRGGANIQPSCCQKSRLARNGPVEVHLHSHN